MRTTVGTFTSQPDAIDALERLHAIGLADDRVILLPPEDDKELIYEVPTTDTERPGVGKAFGGIVGAVAGIYAANLVIPDIGLDAGVSFAMTILCALGGAVAGFFAGRALDYRLTEGLPKDELFVYQDALRQGRSVVVALTERAAEQKAARREMTQAGAERIDAARKKWWLGLRRVESEAYKV